MLATQRRTPTFEETGDVLDKLEELAYGKVTGNCTMRNLTDDNVYAAVLQKGKILPRFILWTLLSY